MIDDLKTLIAAKDYDAAALTINQSEAIFIACSEKIKEQLVHENEVFTVRSKLLLRIASDSALNEARNHFELLRELIALIPEADENAGLSRPLRQAMENSAVLRQQLMVEVSEAIAHL
jgi:hypothetical protein